MPSGPVASPPWATGTWSTTAWEAGTWGTVAAAVDADITFGVPAPTFLLNAVAQRTRVFAEVDLNDPASYFYGYKAGWVLQFHSIRRGLSDRQGQLEHLSFGATLSDTEGYFRGLLDSVQNRYLVNRPLTERMIDDESRRQQLIPRIVANGFISDYSPLPNRQFKIVGQDFLKKRFAIFSSDSSTWQPRVRVDDHPNANNNFQQNIGVIIPIIYRRITDTNLITPGVETTDNGDGQLLPIYGGDENINGEDYAIGILAAHHCAYLEAGFMNPGAEQGVDLESDPDWLTPRNPSAWVAAGFDTPWRTRNGRDYCEIYLKGTAGDMLRAMRGASGDHVAVNVWGRTDTGDDSGELIEDGFEQFYDFLRNYAVPASPWQSGPPLPVPQFPTVPIKVISSASFDRAQLDVLSRITDGYRLDMAIGAANQSWRLGDVIAEFLKDLDCEGYIDHAGRFCLSVEPSALPTTLRPELTDIIHIIENGFSITDRIADFSNVVPYRHTFDYCGRMQAQFSTPWRSQMSGNLELRDDVSIARYEQERSSSTLEFAFIRGKNRSVDSDYYEGGSEQALDIAQRVLYRYSNPRRTVQILTSLNGTSYEPGDVFPVTNQDGVGVTGWTDRHIRVTGHEVLPSKGQVRLDGYDFDAVLEAQAAAP